MVRIIEHYLKTKQDINNVSCIVKNFLHVVPRLSFIESRIFDNSLCIVGFLKNRYRIHIDILLMQI